MEKLPLTVRRSIEIVGIAILLMGIGYASDILGPLILAFFLTILAYPMFSWLKNKRVPESLSIALVLVVLFAVMALLLWFLTAQFSNLLSDFPSLRKNVSIHLQHLSDWVMRKTKFSTQKQIDLLNQQSEKLVNFAGGYLGGLFSSLTGLFVFFGLIPIYIFLLLFYRNLLLRFVFMWFGEADHTRVKETVKETQVIIKSYLLGLMIQVVYITVLLGCILLLFGIKHALLIGVLFAILNLIPYVGALIGNIIGVLLTLTSSSELSPILIVLVSIAVVQFLDNNILMPKIVGSKVRINALTSIVAVIVGGAIAGISGMFLSLPVVAILKVIFDRSNHLKQWGVLFGDERPPHSPFTWRKYRLASASVQKEIQQKANKPPAKK